MEFVEGRTLRRLIHDHELDLQSSIEIALQVADGLAKAHDRGIVHRDIKSDNIMVTPDGHAKILDFGLAKLMDSPSGDGTDVGNLSQAETIAQTQRGLVMGTIAYMSPEQARGRPVSQASDVFSIGVVTYEMVSGELPFKGDSPVDTMHAIAYEEVQPVTVVRKHLPPELHRIVSRCLRKKPGDRYPDAGALAADLKRLKQDLDSGVRRSISGDERLQRGLDWLKGLVPVGPAGLLLAVAILALAVYLLVSDSGLGGLVSAIVVGLLLYRWVRNRNARLVRWFAARARKQDEVQAIFVRGSRITVVVGKAEARVYVRVNDLLETINGKLFYGDRFEAIVRDDLAPDQFREALREPGVVYVREDVLGGAADADRA
jgi:hypothetical protein